MQAHPCEHHWEALARDRRMSAIGVGKSSVSPRSLLRETAWSIDYSILMIEVS
jgi:hypothetical protein